MCLPISAWTRQGVFRRCADVRGKAVSLLPGAIYAAGDDETPLWRSDDTEPPPKLAALDGFGTALYLAECALALTGRFYFLRQMMQRGERRQGSVLGRFAGLQYASPMYMREARSETTGELIGFKRTVNGRDISVAPEAVVWGYQPDPFVEAGPGSADGAAAAYGASVLDSIARFTTRFTDGGMLKMTALQVEGDAVLPAEDRSEVRRRWWHFLRRGETMSEGPPVLNHLKPVVLGDGLKDLDNEALTRTQVHAVCAAFGVPVSLILPEAANYATAAVEERGFYTRTVVPQAALIERAVNRRLLSEYGLRLRFEPQRLEVMQAYELEKAQQVGRVYALGIVSRTEARDLLGYTSQGGDEPAPGTEPSGDAEEAAPESTTGTASYDPTALRSLSERVDAMVGTVTATGF